VTTQPVATTSTIYITPYSKNSAAVSSTTSTVPAIVTSTIPAVVIVGVVTGQYSTLETTAQLVDVGSSGVVIVGVVTECSTLEATAQLVDVVVTKEEMEHSGVTNNIVPVFTFMIMFCNC